MVRKRRHGAARKTDSGGVTVDNHGQGAGDAHRRTDRDVADRRADVERWGGCVVDPNDGDDQDAGGRDGAGKSDAGCEPPARPGRRPRLGGHGPDYPGAEGGVGDLTAEQLVNLSSKIVGHWSHPIPSVTWRCRRSCASARWSLDFTVPNGTPVMVATSSRGRSR